MSSEHRLEARNDAGKQTLAAHGDTTGAVGKGTLTEHLPTTTDGLCAFVKPHAGATVEDGGGYTFLVLADGNFEVTGAPPGKQGSIKHVVTPRTNAFAWNLVAKKLLSAVPPKAAPAAPIATAPPPAPEPGVIDRAMRAVEAGLGELEDGAHALLDRAANWIPGLGDDPAPPAAAQPPSAPAAPTKAPATAGDRATVPAEFQAGVDRVRTSEPRGNTLDLAMSRAALGTEGTEYTLSGLPHADAVRQKAITAQLAQHERAKKANAKSKTATVEGELSDEDLASLKAEKATLDAASKEAQKVLAADIASGREDVTRFYCSGLSMWTLAAAGYDITKRLVGPDGTEYRGLIMKEVDVDANGKQVKKGGVAKKRIVAKTEYVTLRTLVDGSPIAIEIVTRARAASTSTVEITGTGYQTDDDGLAQAAHGAAAAFVAAGIGTEVEELAQKPGDFAQSRRTTAVAGDPELKHHGAGHAWQVVDVKAEGEALFGKTNSPESASGKVGWQTDRFTIKPTTNPALVGAHTVTAAKRVEAQDETVVADKKGDTAHDGGVQVSGWKDAPDAGLKAYTGYVVFYGRLATSPWHGWTKATKETAEAAAGD